MRYQSFLPLSALIVMGLMLILIHFGVVPPGITLLEELKNTFDGYFYVLILAIILLESVVYIGFYFPGQFFAVLLVVLAKPDWSDIIYLTLSMVIAATLGSIINYSLGRRFAHSPDSQNSANKQSLQNAKKKYSIKYLLIAMIHINSLAFYMFKQGAQGRPFKVVWFAGLLNLPYYLMLIFATSTLSEEVMQLAENSVLLISVISVWLMVSVYLDIKKHRSLKSG